MKKVLCLVTLVLLLGFVSNASAAIFDWGGGTSDSWGVGGNWLPLGPPMVGDEAIVNAGGPWDPVIRAADSPVDVAYIKVGDGDGGVGDLTVASDGVIANVENKIIIANGVGSTGTMTINGGSVTANEVVVGLGGVALLNMNGGTLDIPSYWFWITGDGDNGSGHIALNDGVITAGYFWEMNSNGSIHITEGVMVLARISHRKGCTRPLDVV